MLHTHTHIHTHIHPYLLTYIHIHPHPHLYLPFDMRTRSLSPVTRCFCRRRCTISSVIPGSWRSSFGLGARASSRPGPRLSPPSRPLLPPPLLPPPVPPPAVDDNFLDMAENGSGSGSGSGVGRGTRSSPWTIILLMRRQPSTTG